MLGSFRLVVWNNFKKIPKRIQTYLNWSGQILDNLNESWDSLYEVRSLLDLEF